MRRARAVRFLVRALDRRSCRRSATFRREVPRYGRRQVSAQAMLGQAAHGFSSAIEARDDLAKNIDHLLIGVDP